MPSPSPHRLNSLPSFGPNAAGPACNHAVHVKVVCVIPSTVFCADLENDNGLQSEIHGLACCLGKVRTVTWEEGSPRHSLPRVSSHTPSAWAAGAQTDPSSLSGN